MDRNHPILLEELRALIHGCINGDRHLQNQFYNRFSEMLFPVCLQYSKNREEAEEILQEGFLKILTHLNQFKYKGSFIGWMRKIIVNTALEKFRMKPDLYIVSITGNKTDEFISQDEIVEQISAKELISMVQKLSPVYRMVFNLYVFEGMSHKEIAKHLGITESTSRSNLYDARKVLQRFVINSMKTAIQYR